MSFENLIQTLEQKGRDEENATLNAAKIQAKGIQSKSNQQAKQIMEDARVEGKRLGEEAKAEINANARLKQKKIRAEAEHKLITASIQGVEKYLKEFVETPKYGVVLLSLARDCTKALGKDAVVYCRKKDEAKLKNAGFNVAGTQSIIGGVIGRSSDGKIKVDNSLEALLALNEEKLRQIAHRELFGKTSTTANKPKTTSGKKDEKQKRASKKGKR